MSGRLDGTVTVITGAASGIGAACAQRFASEGARIAGMDVAKPSDDSAWKAAEEIASESGFWLGDVRDEGGIETIVAEITERFGRIDSLVNAAGVSTGGAVDELESAEWERVARS